MRSLAIPRGDAAAMAGAGLLAGFLVNFFALLVQINRVSEGSDIPAWYWAFLLNVAALVAGAAWCLMRRPRYRPLGIALLAGFAIPNLGFLIGAIR